MSSPREALPIDDVLAEITAAMANAGATVLVAPPGAGKTTRVPPALVAAGLGPVVVLEPRRIAARAAARRVASELNCEVGGRVGYQVRFDKRSSKDTEILFCTEGILLARLQDDPFLEGVGCVMFDEFHERSLDADLALAMARRTALEVREDLRILVTSATLDPEPASRFLGGAPIVRSEGRSYPVELSFMPRLAAVSKGKGSYAGRGESLEDSVARGVQAALESGEGDVLVFLAGVGEIKRCAARLGGLNGVEIHQLYGDLSPEEQDGALREGPSRRVVLSTNVAESSVTVAGVRAVVDSGEARVLRHDVGSGVDRLRVERIDRAAADQRAGRAGRLGPGRCIRLWSAVDDRALEPFLVPEVRRLDVAGPYLQLVMWGEADPAAFPWFEAPRPDVLRTAAARLIELGALDASGRISPFGRRIARLPLQPRLAALFERAAELGVAELGALAAALLSERDPYLRQDPRNRSRARDATTSDLYDRCIGLAEFERSRTRVTRAGELAPGAAKGVLRVRDQILRQRRKGGAKAPGDPELALAEAVLLAFPDRLARRRSDDGERALMVGGRGLRMGPTSGVTEAELFVAIDVGAGRRPGDEDIVRLASAVEREWVGGGEVKVSTRPVFDPKTERVIGKRREMLGPLVLSESDQPLGRGSDVEEVLLEAAAADPLVALGLTGERVDVESAALIERIQFLRVHLPELNLPEPTEETFRELLPMLVPGCRSFADLRKRKALQMYMGSWRHEQVGQLDREAPERIKVPSGSHHRLAYDGERAPVLSVRIQEMFGLAETPTVARGRVRVLLHLLAPNGRPQQVTDDLASFWSEAYVQVRKDLRGRYPRHPWPENPLEAPPTTRTKRRPR